ncbi:hypothetical protein ABQE02_16435, partial [Enterococcus innesii]
MEFLYPFSMSFFPTSGSVDFVIPLIQILLITFYLYLFVQSFISGFFPKWAIYIFYIIYYLLLIYLLFFKNIGIQGIEWNPLMFIQDLQSSPDSCVKCYTMFLPFLLIKIDVFS